VIDEYRAVKRKRDAGRAGLARLRHLLAVTLDGQRRVAGEHEQLATPARAAAGAAGIGLFRSEFLLRTATASARRDEQYEAYRTACGHARPAGDDPDCRHARKALDRMSPTIRHEHALNPALGLRAIRWSLSEPAMFRQQLRAILRAASHGPVRILIPMVAHLSEVRHGRR
jgi:phosphotransferase system enzyme I (PtsI)